MELCEIWMSGPHTLELWLRRFAVIPGTCALLKPPGILDGPPDLETLGGL